MKETFDSVWGSVKDRFTNPFLGTFLFVWLVRNWSLVYGLFIFDEDCTMDDKLKYVKDHFNDYNVFLEFLRNTGITISLLLIVYIILIGVHYLMRSYKLVISKANARFDKIPVASREHYLLLNTEFKNLSEKYIELTASNDKTLTENEKYINDFLSSQADYFALQKRLVLMLKVHIKALIILQKEDSASLDLQQNYNELRNVFNDETVIISIIEVFQEIALDNSYFLPIIELMFLETKKAARYNSDFTNNHNIIPRRIKELNEKLNDPDLKKSQDSIILGKLIELDMLTIEPSFGFTRLGENVCIKLFEY